jgi:hypothetical protein
MRTRIELISTLTLLALLAAVAGADERGTEELIVISPAVVVGGTTKDPGEQEVGDRTYKKYEVIITKVLRAPEDGPKANESTVVLSVDELKKDTAYVLFLGPKSKHGRLLRDLREASKAEAIKKMLTFEARAKSELNGKAKLLAAFYRANQLRPVLLAAEENKAVKKGDAIDPKETDRLLAILAQALNNATKKGVNVNQQKLALQLQKTLSGVGGLPELRRTRRETAIRFWATRLGNKKLREQYKLAKLTVTDKLAPEQRPVPIVRPVEPPPQPPLPKPPPLAWPNPDRLGKPVDGLALRVRTDKKSYNLLEDPKQRITIEATFKNTGSKPVRLNTYLMLEMLASIQIQRPGGKLRKHSDDDRLRAPELPAMGPWSFKEVKPGETWKVREEMSPYLFPRHGTYRVVVAYRNHYGKRFGIRNAWAGEVYSQALPVHIVRYEEREPDRERRPATPETPKPKAPPDDRQPETSSAPAPPPAAGPVLRAGGQVQVVVPAGGNVPVRVIVQQKALPARPNPAKTPPPDRPESKD